LSLQNEFRFRQLEDAHAGIERSLNSGTKSEAATKSAESCDIQHCLARALDHHRAGRLAEAAQIYRKLLAIDAHNADPLHLLGMIEYQSGRADSAVQLIRAAIALDETQPAYHSNLGTILQSQGQLEQASESYARAMALDPALAEVHYNLGNVFYAQDKFDHAVESYKRAVALQPRLAEAHYNLGNALQACSMLSEAIASYERALAIDPEKYEALHNLGNALQAQDKMEEAMACYQQVLTRQPRYARVHYSVGAALHAMGKVDDALVWYRSAQALQADFAEAAFAESLAQLFCGDFAGGWSNHEKRWQTREHMPPMRNYACPLWNGERLADDRLLLWGEQGIGDEVMFAGLIPDVLRAGNHCVVDCDSRLKPLFARSFPGVRVVSGGKIGSAAENPGHADAKIAAHLPMGSLPHWFRASRAAFAATTSSYLVPDRVERDRFRARYADGRRLVGIAWHTNNRKTGQMRSIDLSVFASLFERPDIRWISLQYGDHSALQDEAAAARAPLVIDRSVNQFVDLDRFAAQIAAMDLVLCIDNSTAHLAGALGVPTWVLLPFVPDWRWLQSGEESLWYPTVRLFRQPLRGDWLPVVHIVGNVL
jgi:tetratricopeptide (TPR) repeat protein